MKRHWLLITGITVGLSSALIVTYVKAHPGRTNSDGCHNNGRTGQYHCHSTTKPVAPNPSPTSAPITKKITVVSVGDGDTFRVNKEGKTITVRLACIDAPETTQGVYGTKATNQLKQLLPVGQQVVLRIVNNDRYGRMVAEVYVDEKLVNLQMVSSGYAAVYPQYLNGCPTNKPQLIQAEETAKQQGKGMWDKTNPIPVMPWDFRRGRNSR